MRKLLVHAAIAATLACGLQASAYATVTNLNVVSSTTHTGATTLSGAFQDYFQFSSGDDYIAGLASTSVSFTGPTTNYGVNLYNAYLVLGQISNELDLVGKSPISFPAVTKLVPLYDPVTGITTTTTTLASWAKLTPNTDYTLVINGLSNGDSGYTAIVAVVPLPLTAPVPEPETYAMLAAGLGMMGLIARRRKKTR